MIATASRADRREPYKDLATAIITAAVRDLVSCEFTILAGYDQEAHQHNAKREETIRKAETEKARTEVFLRGNWYLFLAGCAGIPYSGEWLIDRCRENGREQYREWNSKRSYNTRLKLWKRYSYR